MRYNAAFRAAVSREALLARLGDAEVTLSSSNSYSHGVSTARLSDYIASFPAASSLPAAYASARSNETFYLFGPQRDPAWDALMAQYRRPPATGVDDAVLSFGAGGAGSGVAFHVHGPGYSEVLHGRKRWLLFPPGRDFPFDPDATVAQWVAEVLPKLDDDVETGSALFDCTIGPGELLFFPTAWYHAILNTAEFNVFVSTFL
ncbi:unnamed protein product [Phaeothamnion confervicola]